MKIATLTINPAIDKSSTVEQLHAEVKLKCTAPRYEPGGGGINVSRALHKLGTSSKAIFQSGGSEGELLQHLLREEEINTLPVSTAGRTRENLIITEASSNRQYRFGMPGPTLSRVEYTKFLDALEQLDVIPEIIVASGSLPPGVPEDFYARIAKIARRLGSKLILDTSGAALIESVKKEKVFLLKPNLKELAELTGHSQINGNEYEGLAMQMIEKGKAEMVVVSLGSRGAALAWRAGIIHITPPEIKVRSTVGAGDSMVAGLSLALARGSQPDEILRYGVACGTAAAMSEGTELCRKEDVEQIYNWLKEKEY